MARGKRRRPLLQQPEVPVVKSSQKRDDAGSSEDDDVDQFMERRHKRMLERAEPEDSESDAGDEPENNEHDVLRLANSDSESSDDDPDDLEDGDDAREGWGAKRKNWYGGDTHEYEIMEDEERKEALKDEEEEAVRLQQKALSAMRPEDFRDEDDEEESEADPEVGEGHAQLLSQSGISEASAQVLEVTAPEVPLLVKEMQQCYKQAAVWKSRVNWNETARLVYHLNASFVTNVAFYLSLRTDPESEGIDLRTHPVMARIVRIRTLLKKALSLPCEEPKAYVGGSDIRTRPDIAQGRIRKDLRHKEKENMPVEMEERVMNGFANGHHEVEKSKKKKKRKKKRSATDAVIQEDEEKVKYLLGNGDEPTKNIATEARERDQKRRKLNRNLRDMERERKNNEARILPSGDVDHIREESKQRTATIFPQDYESPALVDDDDEVMNKMLEKKEKKAARKARREADTKPHVYRFKDSVDPESKRRASTDVVRNRGLTRHRPRDKKTPRTKNRAAYSKAVIRRKGAVREYTGKPGGTYAGESSGINMSARKSSKLS